MINLGIQKIQTVIRDENYFIPKSEKEANQFSTKTFNQTYIRCEGKAIKQFPM